MESLLAILLYLQVIMSPATYTNCQIENFENENQVEVNAVRNDPVLNSQVQTEYNEEAVQIHVIDEGTCL